MVGDIAAASLWSFVRRAKYLKTLGLRSTALIVMGLLVSGCTGGGAPELEQPLAAALVVGQGQNQLQVTVRAGSEVILNGENSDGTRFPIDSATWRQTDNTGLTVDLAKRTEFTRSFRVPIVDDPTTLSFELEVVNADGERSNKEVVVRIVPSNDADRFLEFFSSLPNEYTAVAGLQSGIKTTSEVTFTITERQLVNYADRTASSNTANQFDLEIGTSRSRAAAWLNDTETDWVNIADNVNAFYNPNLCFSLPRLDLDDINLQFDDSDPDSGIDEYRVDSVEHMVELTLTVTGGTCADENDLAVDCQDAAVLYVLDANGELIDQMGGATATQRVVSVDALKASDTPTRQPESKVTAAAYYRTVDPDNRRTTLSDWLSVAGFTDGSGSFISESQFNHALYINNYDLGFTRDMFVRKDPATGHVFAYVTNFPALRPAILRAEDPERPNDDVLATVAMEFSPPDQDPGGAPFVKFFVFIPDTNGDQARVSSLNFDGRGEKWIPGACVPCHGGEIRPLDTTGAAPLYPDFGDIDAAFLPWDLDSLLFVDSDDPDLVDPLVRVGFELNPGYLTEDQLEEYSQASQEEDFRHMNEAVLATMPQTTQVNIDRFSLVREQIHGWYGSSDTTADTLPAVSYDPTYIQEGWRATDNPTVAGVESFYSEVFARHCRICHSQAKDINQFESFTAFMSASGLIERYVFEDGLMPNARLDMDRLWVDFHGASTTPASRIADILQLNLPAEFDNGPGWPIARVKGGAIQTVLPRSAMTGILPVTDVIAVENLDGIRFDGSISSFARSFSWNWAAVNGRPGGSSAELVGANTAKPAFMVDVPGEYNVELVVTNSRGTSDVFTVTVDASALGPKSVNSNGPLVVQDSTPDDVSVALISESLLDWMDMDTADNLLLYRVTTAPAYGFISVDGVAASEFTQQQINDGRVTYTQRVEQESPSDSFVYSIEDDTGAQNRVSAQTFDIQIIQRNDHPVEQSNGPLTGVQEGGIALPLANLVWNDWDDPDTAIDYEIVTAPMYGTLAISGGALSAGMTFTQEQVNSGSVTYRHFGSENLSDQFTYTVTDGTILTPIAASGPYSISITAANDSPLLSTLGLSAYAGLDRRITGSLATGSFGAGNIRVSDPDNVDQTEIDIEVTAISAGGEIWMTTTGSPDTQILVGDSFTMAELTDSDPDTTIVFRHLLPYDTSGESFSISVTDGDPLGTAATGTVSVAVVARTDGPMLGGGADLMVTTLTSYLDPAVARDGSGRTGSSTPPWASTAVAAGDLQFVDGANVVDPDNPAPLPGQCAIRYRLQEAPEFGRLLRGATEIQTSTSFTGATPAQIFTQAQINAGSITYQNQTIGDGVADATDSAAELLDRFSVVASDCILEFPAPGDGATEVTVSRGIDPDVDIGWVVDTIWTDAVGTAGTCTDRGCRQCHGGNDASCSVGLLGPNWTTSSTPGGTVQQCNMKASYDSTALPSYPTTAGHTGGVVISTTSNPYRMLQQWQAEGLPTCPP